MVHITVKFNQVIIDDHIQRLETYDYGIVQGYVTHTYKNENGEYMPCGCAVVITSAEKLVVAPLWAIEFDKF